jgi:hypothetical protein
MVLRMRMRGKAYRQRREIARGSVDVMRVQMGMDEGAGPNRSGPMNRGRAKGTRAEFPAGRYRVPGGGRRLYGHPRAEVAS